MANSILFRKLNLQLFAEGTGGAGAGAGDGGTGASGQGVTEAAALPQTKGVKNNPLSNVKYGKQEEAQVANVQSAEAQTEVTVDRNAEYKKLIRGEYKDLFDSDVQNVVQKRLKNSQETVDKYNALAPTLEMLAKKYGVDASDINALSKAIEEDDAYYEEEALEKGISVEQLKNIRKMEKENAELRRQMQEQQVRDNANKLYATWMDQAEQAKTVYPSFDLAAEMQNPQFVNLLKSNVDVRTAYEVLHKDEIIPAAMQFTAKTVEQKIANNIAAGSKRPTENGMSSQSAAVVKSDVSQLSKFDLHEIQRRVARGEKISFG
jgi:hypothetical protein